MRRRRFLKQLAVTPLVARQLSSVPAAGTTTANASGAAKTLPPWAGARAEAWEGPISPLVTTKGPPGPG